MSRSTGTNLDKFKRVVDRVYGEYTGAQWAPKLYPEYRQGGGRYLWTDAFGVCNYITLYCETKEQRYLDQADALIKQVHDILGKDRSEGKRLGQATDEEPLKGGLRIGKNDPEGTPDGDGQYFHYLTKWMFCLNRMSIATGDMKYNEQAIQLVKAAHNAFVKTSMEGKPRMVWKMSVDLQKPAVRSEGNLDPFDGYATYRILQDTAQVSSSNPSILNSEVSDMQKMVNFKYPYYQSDDPLDLGEALWITHWYPEEPWAKHISEVSTRALELLWSGGYFLAPTYYRLAFREFGTTIGVQLNPVTQTIQPEWNKRVEILNNFWEKDLYSRDSNITPIMYCTSLIPGAFKKGYIESKIGLPASQQ